MELTSERGKACGNPTAIIRDKEFYLAAREHIRSNAYRKGEPNLTADMFRAWVSETYQVDVCVDTAEFGSITWAFINVIIKKECILMVTSEKM